MIKLKHRGVINEDDIKYAFNKYKYKIEIYEKNKIHFKLIATKDYSKNFNVNFNGKIKLDVTIFKNMYDSFSKSTYPIFKEKSNLIPKKRFNHVNLDRTFCYAPFQRPLYEKWNLVDFVNAMDALINNYFSIEYIGKGNLIELEHGDLGIQHYEYMRLKK